MKNNDYAERVAGTKIYAKQLISALFTPADAEQPAIKLTVLQPMLNLYVSQRITGNIAIGKQMWADCFTDSGFTVSGEDEDQLINIAFPQAFRLYLLTSIAACHQTLGLLNNNADFVKTLFEARERFVLGTDGLRAYVDGSELKQSFEYDGELYNIGFMLPNPEKNADLHTCLYQQALKTVMPGYNPFKLLEKFGAIINNSTTKMYLPFWVRKVGALN